MTTLQIYNTHKDESLTKTKTPEGEGQYLHIHSLITGERYGSTRVFQAAAVHGIQIKVILEGSTIVWKALVWGQKSLSVVLFRPSGKQCWIHIKEKTFEDWVVDAAWEEDLQHVVVATAHNSLLRIKMINKDAVNHIIPSSDAISFPNKQDWSGECEITAKEQCSENSILYCGCIIIGSGSWKNAVLLAGTVFSQVLIWGPWGKKNACGTIFPSHCLSGHQGVLFSINFCPVNNVITTTSDDRSLRVWSIHKHEQDRVCSTVQDCEGSHENNVLHEQDNDWKHCHIIEKLKCFGHGSRVWKSLILPSCYISIGEDSKVCVWSHSGTLLTSWRAHDGSCVWSVAVSEDADKIVTGGGDGSVKSWYLKLDISQTPETMIKFPWIKEDYQANSSENDGMLDKQLQGNNIQKEHAVECYDDSSSENSSFVASSTELFGIQTGALIRKDTKGKANTSTQVDFPRCVALLELNTCLVLTDSGKLYSWDLQDSKWFLLYEDRRLKSYAVMESSPDQDSVALGTLCGHVIILQKDSLGQCMKVIAEEKVIPGKVYSLLWLNSQQLLTGGSEGLMITWDINFIKGTLQQRNIYTLPACKQRWVSAACLFAPSGKNHLICGDRTGGIHLYSHDIPEVQHSLRGIHGRNGVTSVTTYSGRLYSTGRDGCVRSLTVQDGLLQVVMVTRVSNVNWVAALINLYGRPLAVCFHDVKLKLWSMEEDRAVVDVECGGGHRSWALQFSEEENRLSFIYLKDTKPYTFCTTIKDKLMPLIKTPVNTRETMCLQVLFQVKDVTVFATGGEDTTLRLHTVFEEKLNTLGVIRSHISNVRAMCLIDYADGRSANYSKKEIVWIVSTGGRAQLKVWKATLNPTSDDGQKAKPLDVTCREVTSHMLRTGSNKTWKSQEMTVDPETRYMDVTAFWVSETHALIILASSDGFLRFFEFDSELEKVKLVCSQAWNHCLLKVEKIHLYNLFVLVSAATDGFLVFWNIQPLIECICQGVDYSHHQPEVSKLASIKTHQSGINSIAINSNAKAESDISNICNFIIASGGDDNKIGIWEVTADVTDIGKPTLSISHVHNAYGHASQITGLHWLTENHLVSISIDQRLIVWRMMEQRGNASETPLTLSWSSSNDKRSNNNETCDVLPQTIGKIHHGKGNQSGRVTLEHVSSYFSGVPDVKGLNVCNIPTDTLERNVSPPNESSGSKKRIFVYGLGLQLYDIEVNGT